MKKPGGLKNGNKLNNMNKGLDRKVGVWLDHAKAHFIDFSKGPAIVETVYSEKESNTRYAGEHGNATKLVGYRVTNNEHHAHNRSGEILHHYYKTLTDRLKAYDRIYLFGPTVAKEELYNLLKKDSNFSKKEIEVKSADNLTENQMVAEVKAFFGV